MKGSQTSGKRLKLFENAFLEMLTVVSVTWFIVTWSVLLPLIALAGWGTVSPLAAIGLVALGLFAWSLFEYCAHRFAFHWESDTSFIAAAVFVIHGNHHLQPRDLLRNLMPPIVSIPIGLCIWGLLYLVFGPAGTWLFLGFMGGYVAYDLTHYACHQWPMRSALGQMLKRHHMRHHFTDNEGNFAITAIFWDRVFGSRINQVKPSEVASLRRREYLPPAE